MAIFADYADYYDVLYQDKDYPGEVDFIHGLIQSHRPQARTVLDLGCGTGRHSSLLVQKGYSVQGIDQSVAMLAKAEARRASLSPALAENLQFEVGDIRELTLDRKFDVVLLLFHVLSYQISHQDLLATLTTVRQHLQPGGILIFDCWYGPAILTDPPLVRVKRAETDSLQITRISEPQLMVNDNCVDVHYQLFIHDQKASTIQMVQEVHQMRYFFAPELSLLLQQCHLQEIARGEWMTGLPLSQHSWSTYFIAQECN
ncbi:class I SAM-dependent methyltransferase [Synechocystis sp. LKSZ1]|uniref:class I SAM-dependent DNA methyltransferase n=1 Tax=Synechocystis sp. LKSZ1 TaxID=3144951 RepID=UPI00336C0237